MKRILFSIFCILLIPAIFAEAGTEDKNAQLIQAAENDNIQEMQNALTDGADVNDKTALKIAKKNGQKEIVEILEKAGAME